MKPWQDDGFERAREKARQAVVEMQRAVEEMIAAHEARLTAEIRQITGNDELVVKWEDEIGTGAET